MASEADTRANYIDPALRAADWQPSNIIREHYFTDGRKMAAGAPDDALNAAQKELGGAPHIVLGSDLVYNQATYPLLVTTVAQLCERGATVLLAQQRRFKHEGRFFTALAKHKKEHHLMPHVRHIVA